MPSRRSFEAEEKLGTKQATYKLTQIFISLTSSMEQFLAICLGLVKCELLKITRCLRLPS